jgi:hypothetical protein
MKTTFTVRVPKDKPKLIDHINKVAGEQNTSFNAAIIFLIEKGLSIDADPDQDISRELKEIKQLLQQKTKKPVVRKWEYIDELLDQFYDAFQSDRGQEYMMKYSAKDRAAMGKLLNEHKKKNPGMDSSQVLASFRGFFRRCVEIRDSFHYHNMSVPIIHSRLTQIINLINTNDGKTRPNQISERDIKGIVEKSFGKNH